MIIEKERLEFLETYFQCCDSKTQLGDKVYIKLKDGILDFVQFTSSINLFTRLEVGSTEEFNILLSTKQLYNLIKTIKDTEFQINKDGIKFGKNSSYQFQVYDLKFPTIDDFFNQIQNPPDESFKLSDFSNSTLVRSFAGKEEMNVISYEQDCFIGSDRLKTCISKTKNEITNEIFYIPKEVFNLFVKCDFVEIRKYKKFWNFEYNKIQVIVPYKKYGLPSLFTPGIKVKYDHQFKMVLDKNTLLDTLKRMLLVTSDNPGNRIYCKIDKSFIIENKEFNKSLEEIEYISCDSEIQNIEFTISCNNLYTAIANLEGKEVWLHISENINNRNAIKLQDETKNIIIVLILMRV